MNHADALENLRRATDVLAALGARPFLVDGTLLGCVREGGFIAHDTDVDLGVFADEMPDPLLLTNAMDREGFAFYREHGTPSHGHEVRYERRKIRVDVFVYYTDERGHYHAAWQKGKPIRYSYPAFDLAPLSFLGHTFLAPQDPEAFLAAKYGLEWRTPTKEWDWAWGPHNAGKWQ